MDKKILVLIGIALAASLAVPGIAWAAGSGLGKCIWPGQSIGYTNKTGAVAQGLSSQAARYCQAIAYTDKDGDGVCDWFEFRGRSAAAPCPNFCGVIADADGDGICDRVGQGRYGRR